MNKYKVRVYEATGWSLLTQADHFEDFTLTSTETLEQIAKRLAHSGFAAHDRKWVMPGAIMTVEKID